MSLRAPASLIQSPGEGRDMVARGEAPQGARTPGIGHKNKCEPRQGWHNAWREIPHCFIKIPLTQKTLAHNGSELPSPRLAALACSAVAGRFATVLGASRLRLLRPHRRPYLSAYAASLRSVAPGSIFFFYDTRGSTAPVSAAAQLRRGRSPFHPGLYYLPPLPGLKFRLAGARTRHSNSDLSRKRLPRPKTHTEPKETRRLPTDTLTESISQQQSVTSSLPQLSVA